MSNNNYENIYEVLNCISEAKNSAYSAVNNFFKLPNILDKYHVIIPLILSKTSELNSANSIVKNGYLIYEISQIITKAVNTSSKDWQLINNILEDGQNAVNKIYEAANHLSIIVANITDSYLSAPYKEQIPLFDSQIPNSTSNIDYYKLSGEVVKLVEAY